MSVIILKFSKRKLVRLVENGLYVFAQFFGRKLNGTIERFFNSV